VLQVVAAGPVEKPLSSIGEAARNRAHERGGRCRHASMWLERGVRTVCPICVSCPPRWIMTADVTALPTIQLFDTMSGTRRALVPVKPGHVGLYVCGVTVYDLTHIGHARVFLSFDFITRYLRHRGYEVTYVRNHTDVDDKIIKRANERNMDPIALAQEFIDALDSDMGRLGILKPTVEPRVSTHMPQIVGLVETLVEKGHAYAVEGDVYYAVDSFPEYGKLSGTKIEDLRAGERVAIDERKKNPADFALWKSAKPGEPTWASPWGPGRPGWHIECSAMSHTHLGAHFDIHGGGKDLVFPHHENEIAQSEGAHGGCYAANWMHIGLVNVDGEKMSKSLGNFWTVRDVLENFHPQAIRYFMLSAHYRKPISYSQTNLELAGQRADYLYRTRLQLQSLLASLPEVPAADTVYTKPLFDGLYAGMDDDFNSPVALAVIADAARKTNELLVTKKLGKRLDVQAQLVALGAFFDAVKGIFGLLEGDLASTIADLRALQARRLEIDTDEVARLLVERTNARAAKDYVAADEVRKKLADMHVDVMDTPEGTDWRIVSPLLESEGELSVEE